MNPNQRFRRGEAGIPPTIGRLTPAARHPTCGVMDSQLGPTSNRFISQRLRLNYVDWGNAEAPLLILQHGGRDHCRSWDWVAQELRHDWHVICPDLRGHGDSEWSAEGHYGMDAYVYDFAQLVHTLGDPEVTIVAHSLGGAITTRYAGLFPERVAKFVNIEGLGPGPQHRREAEERGVSGRLHKWISDKRKASARTPRRYTTRRAAYERMKAENTFLTDEQARHLTIHGASRNEDGTWSWKFDNYVNVWSGSDLSGDEIESLWRAVTCPTLFLWGKDSFADSPASDGRLDHFPTARLIEYENAGHWLHHDQYERFMQDIRDFLG